MKTTTTNQKAVEAYKTRLAQVQEQLARLQDALVADVDDGRWRGEKLHWGHVGDLGYVADELKSVADFLTGEGE
jgi:hypothetical protein